MYTYVTESGNLSGDGTTALLETHCKLPPPDSHTSDYNIIIHSRKLNNVKIFEMKIFQGKNFQIYGIVYLVHSVHAAMSV